MAATLRINGRDYSSWLKLFAEESVGVVDAERLSPQFAGNAALSEGAVWIGTSSTNKHWTVGVIVRGASLTVDSVNQMVRDIRGDLYRGAVVEYAPDGASQTTFFELEAGEFRPNYNHPRYRHGYVEGVLELWTRPYGSTGTTRLVASVAGTGPQQLSATGILGDVPAYVNLDVLVGSQAIASSPNRAVMYGVHRSASFMAVRLASSWDRSSFAGNATVRGASGAIGSGFVGYDFSATVSSRQLLGQIYLTPPGGHVGRHRAILIARSNLSAATAPTFSLEQSTGTTAAAELRAPVGTAVATQNQAGAWQLLDMGEVSVPAVAAGQSVPTVYLTLYGTGATGASTIASDVLQAQALVLVPLDIAAGVLMPSRAFLPGARNRYRIESYPRARTVRGTATTYDADLAGVYRGVPPRIPAVGSPGASGPAQLIVLDGQLDKFVGNAALDVAVEVREAFSFYR